MPNSTEMPSKLAYGYHSTIRVQKRWAPIFMNNKPVAGERRQREDLRLWNLFTAEPMAASFSTLAYSEESPLYSKPHFHNQQVVLVDPIVRWYHPSMTAASLQAQYRLKAQCLIRSLNLFRINAVTLLNLKHLLLPPRFPLHIDSIRADLLSQQMSFSNLDPIRILEYFRQETVSAYVRGDNMHDAPAMFSYATIGHHSVPVQLGVSAPRCRGTTLTAAAEVRDHRRRQCWGEERPPVERELWKHGNCAEHQSFPSVVAWCERLGLENVVVETLAVKKSGEFVGMCKNCTDYVSKCVLRKHPTWKVYDAYTTKILQTT